MTLAPLLRALDRRAERGRPAQFWLRDDDAVEPTGALDRLIDLTAGGVPLTLAVIPAFGGQALADRLAGATHVTVAAHGWSHDNHAPPGEKKQELGLHRPVGMVLDQLAQGRAHLAALHDPHFIPMLVPPWNRIDADVVAGLPELGFHALSVFGPEHPGPLRVVNTHVDLIDWRGTRGGRSDSALVSEIVARLDTDRPIGLLTHHLVHDTAAWDFLARLFTATIGHVGCHWVSARALIG